MRYIADLHVHSRHSRGCSTQLGIDKLEKYAGMKGVDVLGTGDFTHPEWIKELKQKLTEDGSGILRTAKGYPFVMQTEISLIYSQGGKGRRVHNVVLAPGFEVADQITDELKKRGRVDYDGRPIFKLSCMEFTELMTGVSRDVEVIPAHIWTPWFSLFGSKSGFDSIKEAFGDQLKNIHAIETGLSSDPPMNWRLSQLDSMNIVSFSDLHSYWPWRIGRESTIFELDRLSYAGMIKAIRTGKGLAGTVEVDPAYGKYHEDGHRNCNVCMTPSESNKADQICPKCKRPLTIGVHHRVEELADRPEGYRRPNAKPFYTLMPLSELIANVFGKGIATKKVWEEYGNITKLGSEIEVLLDIPFEKLATATTGKMANAIIMNREGKIEVKPGYDGRYGIPLFKEDEREYKGPQKMPGDAPEKQENQPKGKRDAKKDLLQKGLSDF